MGKGGCVWVRWGTVRMRNTKTRQAGGIYGVSGHILRPMAGEISPDIMFWGVCQKVMWMGANECAWVCWDS